MSPKYALDWVLECSRNDSTPEIPDSNFYWISLIRKDTGTKTAVLKLTKYVEEIKKRNRHVLLLGFHVSGSSNKVYYGPESWKCWEISWYQTQLSIPIIKSLQTQRTIDHYDETSLIISRELLCRMLQGCFSPNPV